MFYTSVIHRNLLACYILTFAAACEGVRTCVYILMTLLMFMVNKANG